MTNAKRFITVCIVFLSCYILSSWLFLFAQVDRVAGHSCKVLKDADGMRGLLPDCWYQKAAGLKVVTFKKNLHYGHELSLDPAVLSNQLDEIKAQGFSAIEIFAPADGLTAYNGLDQQNYYRIDPELGTMDDFRRAVRLAHSKGLAAIIFVNLGYYSVEAPDWIQATRDKKNGVVSDKTKWFLWSDRPDAPVPLTQEDIYVTPEERAKNKAFWGWHYSEAAGAYYWARWQAEGSNNSVIPLPQMNWGDPGWREEAERIVRFWMDTGIDGMLIDAPLCYPNQTWAHNRNYITSVIASYGNTLIDPEGGRATTAWITEAGYDTMHDYYPDYVSAIESGNPNKLESSLIGWHDAIVESGGTLYSAHWSNKYAGEPAKRHLQQALIVGVGGIVVYTKFQGNPDAEEARNLHLKQLHPALFPTARRRKLATNSDDKYYAILKTAEDRSERMVLVYNFQSTPQTVQVNLGDLDSPGIVDVQTAEVIPQPDQFHPVPVDVPANGYRFFTVFPHK
ncbi:MAG TPA: alpha-amylase family glycosyl hydrolase [Dongiaceae bacterium]|nr:alpha-amylase family glycosyl hydrolase [Dongiaceae bacterium]